MDSYIVAEVRMVAEVDGGRRSAISAGYCPHLVVPPADDFLAVRVFEVDGPNGERAVSPGTTALVMLQFMYPGDVDYSALVEGAEFNIHEGPRVVGTGKVLERL